MVQSIHNKKSKLVHLLQSSYFSNAPGSKPITNLKPKVRNRMYCFLHPEDYRLNVETRTKRKKKTTKKRKKRKTTKKNRRKKKRNIAATRSKRTSKMRKGTPCSSFMPLSLNFSEKSPGNSGLKLLVLA